MKKLLIFVFATFFANSIFAQSKSDYVGIYNFSGAPFAKIVVSIDGNALMAEAEGVGKGEINATDVKDQFKEPNNDATIIFNRDSNGNVVSMLVKVQGSELIGEKEVDAKIEYVGKYKFDDNSPIPDITVTIKNGELYGDTEQGGAALKFSKVKDTFDISGYDGTCTFKRTAEGKISGVNLKVQGMDMNGTKQ
jgi:hypothetical protein